MNFISIILNVCFVVLIVFWFIRFLSESGLGVLQPERHPNNKFLNFTLKKYEYKSETPDRKDFLKVFGLALAFRIGVYLVSALIGMLYTGDTPFNFESFLGIWNRWDSPHYIELAQNGYADHVEEGQHLFVVFFPLYPWVLRIFHAFTGFLIKDWALSGMILSTLLYCFGVCFLYGALSEDYGKDISLKTIVLMSAYPFGFFFGGIMTESIFLFNIALAFWLIKRHKWVAVGIVGILCSLSRVQGVIILGVAGVEFFEYYKPFKMVAEKKGKELVKLIFTKGIWIFLTPIGVLIYLYINKSVEGDWFAFRKFQSEHWFHNNVWFTKCIEELLGYFKRADISQENRVAMFAPALFFFFLAFILLFYGLRRHYQKYTAYLFVYTLINFSVTWLISGGRYMLLAIPMYIIGGEILDRHKKVYPWVIMLSALLMGMYLTGYIQWKQIM